MSIDELESTLEHRLSGLADRVTATPDQGVRKTVGHRAGRLRHRRRVRTSIGASGLVVALAGGGFWLLDRDGPGVSTNMYADTPDGAPVGEPWPAPPPGGDELPAITVENGDEVIEGLERASAIERSGPRDTRWPKDVFDYVPPHATQAFRQPDTYGAPAAVVSYMGPCTPEAASGNRGGDCSAFWHEAPSPDLAEVVQVGDQEAYLWQDVVGTDILHWTLPDQSTVKVESVGVPIEELLAFAAGLERLDGEPGFTATVLPLEMVEHPVGDLPERLEVRTISFSTDAARGYPLVDIWVDRGGAGLFEAGNMDHGIGLGRGEKVTVLDRPALLTRETFTGPTLLEEWGWAPLPPAGFTGSGQPETTEGQSADLGPRTTGPVFETGEIESWKLEWRHTDGAVVFVALYNMDREQVNQIIDRLHELDEAGWQALEPDIDTW